MTSFIEMLLNNLTMLKIILYITIHKHLMIIHTFSSLLLALLLLLLISSLLICILIYLLILLLIHLLELEFAVIRIDEIQQELNIKAINYNVATLLINEKHQISKTQAIRIVFMK